MEAVKEHVTQFYAYHGIEVTRSNSETCVVTLPPQFKDLSAFTADLWCEFNVVVDISLSHGTIEATLRLDNARQDRTALGGVGTLLAFLILVVALVIGGLYIPQSYRLINVGRNITT